MLKPQMKSDFCIKNDYPEAARVNYERVTENIDNITKDYLNEMIDEIYKDAYLDGFRDALFYAER